MMKQSLSIVFLCASAYFVTGCKSASPIPVASMTPSPSPTPVVTPSPTPAPVVSNDLDILNGTELLATGIDATANSGTPANCASQLAFLPKKLQGWVIAFGISFTGVDFSVCSAKITCTAGDQYELLGWGSLYGGNSISAFNSSGPSIAYQSVFTCPESGSYEIALGSAQTESILELQLKTWPPTETALDTEYLIGGNY